MERYVLEWFSQWNNVYILSNCKYGNYDHELLDVQKLQLPESLWVIQMSDEEFYNMGKRQSIT